MSTIKKIKYMLTKNKSTLDYFMRAALTISLIWYCLESFFINPIFSGSLSNLEIFISSLLSGTAFGIYLTYFF